LVISRNLASQYEHKSVGNRTSVCCNSINRSQVFGTFLFPEGCSKKDIPSGVFHSRFFVLLADSHFNTAKEATRRVRKLFAPEKLSALSTWILMKAGHFMMGPASPSLWNRTLKQFESAPGNGLRRTWRNFVFIRTTVPCYGKDVMSDMTGLGCSLFEDGWGWNVILSGNPLKCLKSSVSRDRSKSHYIWMPWFGEHSLWYCLLIGSTCCAWTTLWSFFLGIITFTLQRAITTPRMTEPTV